MITKILRDEKEKTYDLKVTDKNNHSFIMTVAGNHDLYWLPENHKKNREFTIEKNDEIVFSIFEQLFNAVEKKDDKYRPVLKDNVITFLSEDWPDDECNTLEILKLKDSFEIKFIKNENEDKWTSPHLGCSICFCNSGSRVPRVENLFMRMFTYLAYQCNLIPLEEEQSMQN